MYVDPESIQAPEIQRVQTVAVQCDGGGGASGHPLVYLRIGESGYVECPYCDKRFVLDGDDDA